jgi:hypothetical protein
MVGSIGFPRRLLLSAAICSLLSACGTSEKGADAFTPDIREIGNLIATGAKYPHDALDLTSSAVRLRIEISDPKLAAADESTRRSAAVSLVAVAESVLASHKEYAELQAISVAIVHPSASGSDWHTEDVVEFRKGSNQRFSEHTT